MPPGENGTRKGRGLECKSANNSDAIRSNEATTPTSLQSHQSVCSVGRETSLCAAPSWPRLIRKSHSVPAGGQSNNIFGTAFEPETHRSSGRSPPAAEDTSRVIRDVEREIHEVGKVETRSSRKGPGTSVARAATSINFFDEGCTGMEFHKPMTNAAFQDSRYQNPQSKSTICLGSSLAVKRRGRIASVISPACTDWAKPAWKLQQKHNCTGRRYSTTGVADCIGSAPVATAACKDRFTPPARRAASSCCHGQGLCATQKHRFSVGRNGGC